MLDNSIGLRSYADESDDDAIDNGQSTIDMVSTLGSSVLISNIPGASYSFSTDSTETKAAKISTSLSSTCGFDNVQLSDELLDQRSNYSSSYMDCTTMMVESNLYASSNYTDVNNTWQSDFFLLDVTNEDGDDSDSGRRRRRRLSSQAQRHTQPHRDRKRRRMEEYNNNGLQNDRIRLAHRRYLATTDNDNGSNSSNGSSSWLSACQPILFTLNTTNSTFWSGTTYPQCSYWNETSQEYLSDGCFVLYSTDAYTICACR